MRTPPPRARSDRGIATIWTVVVAAACLLVVGLVLDGGAVLRSRSLAFDLAGGSARAGAQELDQAALAEGLVVLDPARASQVAREWLAARDATGDVDVSDQTITVTVYQSTRLQLLRPGTVTVRETATVRANHGSDQP